jgi:glycosyltransferase involved in cell wall biosynthesis
MGIPVVSTAEAAKGVQCIPGEHFLVARDAAGFADTVIQLIENTDLRKKLSEAGRRQIELFHSWDYAMKSLTDAL